MAQPTSNWRTLRSLINQHFDAAELKQLCFDLQIDWDNLAGETKQEKIRSLLHYIQRHGRLPELLDILHKERPDVPWPTEFPDPLPDPTDRYGRSPQGKPLQRPPQAQHFTGREADLDWLIDALQPGRVVTVWASGGMGKTALSAEALWNLAPGDDPPERFPDGIIFYSFYDRSETEAALDHIVKSFDENAQDFSADAARRALAGKRALLILDGAEDAQDLNAVLNLRDSNGLLITTRKRQDAPDHNWRRELKPLPGEQAVTLLNAWQAADVSDQIGQAIVEQVGRLPLAVCLAGRYLDQTGESPSTYLRWLKETPVQTLSVGEHREESVQVLLEKSLAQVGQLARQALSVAGQLAFSDFSWQPLSEALQEEERPLRQALNQLFNFGLLGRAGDERYALSHALVHTYARRRLAFEANTVQRLVAYYTGLVEVESQKSLEGFRRLDLDRPHFLPLLRNCLAIEQYESATKLVWALSDYLDYQGYWIDWIEVLLIGVAAAWELNNRQNESSFLLRLGLAYRQQGQVMTAIDYHEQALAISQEIGDRQGEGAELGNLGLAYSALGQVEKAIDYYQQALAISQEIGDRQGEGSDLGNLGLAYADLGKVKKAIKYHEQALAISQEIGDRHGEGQDLGNLGNAYAGLGQVEKAIEYHEQALAISREIGDRQGEGNNAWNLGLLYEESDPARAIELMSILVAYEQEIGHPDAEADAQYVAAIRARLTGDG